MWLRAEEENPEHSSSHENLLNPLELSRHPSVSPLFPLKPVMIFIPVIIFLSAFCSRLPSSLLLYTSFLFFSITFSPLCKLFKIPGHPHGRLLLCCYTESHEIDVIPMVFVQSPVSPQLTYSLHVHRMLLNKWCVVEGKKLVVWIPKWMKCRRVACIPKICIE